MDTRGDIFDLGMSHPSGSEMWKHPNLVIGYVPQRTALPFPRQDQYMLWCHQTGEDLEEMGKAGRQITAEEQMIRASAFVSSLLQM